MVRFEIRQGNYGRVLSVKLRNDDGSAWTALPNTSTATFTMMHQATGHTVSGAAVIGGANRDTLSYTFADGDTDREGLYDAWFDVLHVGGANETFPTCDGTNGLVVEVCPKRT